MSMRSRDDVQVNALAFVVIQQGGGRWSSDTGTLAPSERE